VDLLQSDPSPRRARPRTGRARSRPAPDSPGLTALRALVGSFSFAEIERRASAGLEAVWGGSSWEAPLLHACGVVPVAMSELWREHSREAEAVGEAALQIPSEFCSMVKVVAGRLHLRGSGTIRRIVHFGGGCEPMGIALELMRREGYDVHTIEGAHAFRAADKRPEAVALLAGELDRAARWLTGGPVDEARLAGELRRKNALLRKLRRVLVLRRVDPGHLPSVATVQLINGSSHFYGDAAEYERILDLLVAELEAATPAPPGAYVPLVLAGGMIAPGLLEVIEEARGAVVGWLLVGTRDYREDVPPLESLAHHVLDAQANGELGEGAGSSAARRRHRVEELVSETGARGVVSTAVTGCPYASIAQQFERAHFKALGIPFIGLEADVHRERPSEEQITRVRTFMEMLP
jgi:benzoyl-CoA reductase/2-hydroxyglutaryl-CoA dehydratase subunit BcrC/BadD/HgdB